MDGEAAIAVLVFIGSGQWIPGKMPLQPSVWDSEEKQMSIFQLIRLVLSAVLALGGILLGCGRN